MDEMDWSYIELLRKAYENEFRPEYKMQQLHQLQGNEVRRDFHTGSIRQINHLIQIGPPNLALKAARCEIYKISVRFELKG